MKLPVFFCALVILVSPSPLMGKDPETIFKESINGIVWIRNFLPGGGEATGSGVLIDEERKLILTNAHVLKDEIEAGVYFSVNDTEGNLRTSREFYETHKELLTEKRAYSGARLAAIDTSKDLAVMHVWVTPPWATKIPIRSPSSMEDLKKGDLVHVLGNPGGRPLWQWSLGSFDRTYRHKSSSDGMDLDLRAIAAHATIYFGNSGGAMLDNDGKLIGVTRSMSGDGLTMAHGIHSNEISSLVDTIELRWVFTLTNSTRSDFHYMISDCGIAEDDEDDFLKPNHYATFSCTKTGPRVKYWYTTSTGRRVDKNYEIGASPLYKGDGVEAEREDGFEYEAKWDDGELKIFREE